MYKQLRVKDFDYTINLQKFNILILTCITDDQNLKQNSWVIFSHPFFFILIRQIKYLLKNIDETSNFSDFLFGTE